MVKTYVLSIPGSPRRAPLELALSRAGVPFDFSDGVLVSEDEAFLSSWLVRVAGMSPAAAQEVASKNTLTRGSLGCLLAFLEIYVRIAREGHPLALILEDDVVPNPTVDFVTLDLASLVPPHADYVFVNHYPCGPCGCQSSLVTLVGAQKIVAGIPTIVASDTPIDLFLWLRPSEIGLTIDELWRRGAGRWLFYHASGFDNIATSERMQLNYIHNNTVMDHGLTLKTQEKFSS